jgi:hypothetical protein
MNGCGLAQALNDGTCFNCGFIGTDGKVRYCPDCQKLIDAPPTKEQLQKTIDEAQKVIDSAKAQIAVLDKKG